MQDRVNFDPSEDMVWIDLSDLTLTSVVVDTFIKELIRLATVLPHKVYALLCWHHTTIPFEVADYYAQESAKIALLYLGLLHYAVTDPYTNVTLRMQTLRNPDVVVEANPNIYTSKEEALSAIHQFRKSPPAAVPTSLVRRLATAPLSASAVMLDALEKDTLDTDKEKASHLQLAHANQLPYYDDAFITVSWVVEWQCVLVTWKKFAEGEDYRYGLNKTLELFQLKTSHLLLSDSRLQGVVTSANQTWTVQEWREWMLQAGLRKSAVLIPERATTQMSLNHMLKNRPSNNRGASQTAFFSSIEEASAWLLQKAE
jgi:hypothetical protein